MSKNKKIHGIELSEEEFDKFMQELESFDTRSFMRLARTDRFEIIPTIDEEGQILSEQDLAYLKEEVEKLGHKILYRVDKANGETLLINPETMKVMVLKEGAQ